jgi:hypothetical protein
MKPRANRNLALVVGADLWNVLSPNSFIRRYDKPSAALQSFPGCCAARRIKLRRHSPMCNCTSWMRHLAQARNPYSLSWLWIPGSRKSAPRNDGRISIRDTSENGQRTTRLAQVICPSGGFLTGLSSLISDFPKNISVPTHPKSHLEFSHPTPPEGRWPSSRTRGGMRWTQQRFARKGIAGQVERFVSDQQHADE